MRKTVWKLQNMSKNRFLQGKHHLVPAVLQAADIFTKPLTRQKIDVCLDLLGLQKK